jgi:hypothetical protein
MCRTEERAIMVRVERHPDSRSFAVWSTAFGASGQGELFGDVVRFADDTDGRASLTEVVLEDVAAWLAAGFSIKAGSADYT